MAGPVSQSSYCCVLCFPGVAVLPIHNVARFEAIRPASLAGNFAQRLSCGAMQAKQCEFVVDIKARTADPKALKEDARPWRRRKLLEDVSPEASRPCHGPIETCLPVVNIYTMQQAHTEIVRAG